MLDFTSAELAVLRRALARLALTEPHGDGPLASRLLIRVCEAGLVREVVAQELGPPTGEVRLMLLQGGKA